MSANFLDFAEYIESSNKALKNSEKCKLNSDEYWKYFNEKVLWDRKILMLMPDKNLTKEQIAVLKKKRCQAFNIWF